MSKGSSMALGVALALIAESVVDTMTIFYTLLSVSLFVPIMAGLYLRWTDTPEIITAILSGVAAVLGTQLTMSTTSFGVLTPAMVGLLVSMTAAGVVGTIRTRMGQKRSET